MKKRVINLVIDACYRIDKKRGVLEHYESEPISSCGYYYYGLKGILYSSKYYEGIGIENANVLGFRFSRGTEDGLWWSFDTE